MKCKIDKVEGIKVSPLDMLRVILIGRACMVSCVVKHSLSSPSLRDFDHKFLYAISEGERSHTLNELLKL